MKYTLFVCTFVAVLCSSTLSFSQSYKALFDNTKNETAGNADWIIDTQQPIPSPAQSGITSSTAESYWLGAISAWGVDLVKKGFTVHTLTSTYGITYGNSSNTYDLSNYDLFIVCEPQNPFTTAEKLAIKSFVQNGGGLMMVADHNSSDRDSDGWDSPEVWNNLPADTLFGIHFQSNSEANNSVTGFFSNLATGTDSIINGAAGTVTAISYNAGTTMRLLTTLNLNAAGHIWMNSITKGTTQIVAATSRYGAGKVAAVGDSSPADDSTGQSGNSLYNGWTVAGATDNIVFLNMCLWLVASDQASVPAQVTLSSPANSSTNQSVPITFRWRTTSGATKYEFDLSTSSGFSTYITLDSTLTDTQRIISGLNLNTTYYWRVRANNSEGWGSFSSIWSLTTFDVPSQVTLASPANAATSISVPTTLRWHPISGVTKYEFDLSTSASFSSYVTLDSALTDTQKVISGLNLNSIYYWRVRAQNTAGWGSFSTTWNFTTFDIPSQVTLASPADAATSIPVPTTLKWHTISGTTKYELDISTSSSFLSYVTLDSALTDTQRIVTGLSLNTMYYWRVRAKNNAGWGSYSVIWSFTTFDVPTSVTLGTPLDSIFSIPTPTKFTWQQLAGITSYEFDLSLSASFSSYVIVDSSLTDTTTTVTGLALNTKYYWRVRAKNLAGWGSFSPVYSFSTWDVPPVPQLDAPPDGSMNLQTPIPFRWNQSSGSTAYQFVIARDSAFVSIAVSDSALSDTTYTVSVLSRGTYYWHVRSKNAAGWSNYSPLRSFSVIDIPPAVVLHSPGNKSYQSSALIQFTWHPALDAVTYQIQSSEISAFDSLILIDSLLSDTTVVTNTMKTSGTYYWRVRAQNPLGWGEYSDTWSVTISDSSTVSDTLQEGWNLVSLPFTISDPRVHSVFPSAISSAFGYQNAYVPTDTLERGVGYWIKFDSLQIVTIGGISESADTITVNPGWNLIGVYSHQVIVDSITTEPMENRISDFYSYDLSYTPSTVLSPLRGYWVKCKTDGVIIFHAIGITPADGNLRNQIK
jgi:hypothetical protein